jgi:hypothetical protein
MQPWIVHERIDKCELLSAVEVLEASRNIKKMLFQIIADYDLCEGQLVWVVSDIPKLQAILRKVLSLSDNEFGNIVAEGNPEALRRFVADKTKGFTDGDINEVCHILTKEVGVAND